ncbi:MAG TPA: hypothetical protein DCS93_03865 [Microscillaceae bacterium]|nr:hypothetical protein [Microscillaceae bacterium]
MLGEDFIREVDKELYPFIKKILGKFWGYTDINKDIEDVLQESWESFFLKYSHRVSNDDEVRALMFTIAKNTAFYHFRKFNRMMIHQDDSQEYASTVHFDGVYEMFLSEDINVVLACLDEKQAFIMKAVMSYEDIHKQEEIVNMIKSDYQKKFGKKLNVALYRKTKERAQKKIRALVQGDKI